MEGHTPHRPHVDAVRIRCGECGEQARRIADVGNPWLDAGIVPYSTMGWRTDPELALTMVERLRFQDDDRSPRELARRGAAEREAAAADLLAAVEGDVQLEHLVGAVRILSHDLEGPEGPRPVDPPRRPGGLEAVGMAHVLDSC